MAFRPLLSKSVLMRSLSTATSPIKNVTVVGAGLMGAGIAQVAAAAGLKVTMIDVEQKSVDKGKDIIKTSLTRIAKKKFKDDPAAAQKYVDQVFSNICTGTDAATASKSADLIVEAIVESLRIKRQLFEALDKHAPKNAILVSNTSSLPISDIATAVNRKSQMAGLHFFNPVPQMKLVEVIRTKDTSDETYNRLIEFSKTVGKVPVTCKDTPGFIVNRLLVPYMMEAVRMVERGDATKEDVDIAMKLGAGYPMGPFELMDYVGLDTLKFITDGWYQSKTDLGGDKLVGPSPTLDKLVHKGALGRKSGNGFYSYEQ